MQISKIFTKNTTSPFLFIFLIIVVLVALKNLPDASAKQSVVLAVIQPTQTFIDVPFVSQAPDADWQNPFFTDGCEETSALMAMHWVQHAPITKSGAVQEITDLTKFEIKKFGGFFPNISAEDTVTLIQEYYGYQGIQFAQDITTTDIKNELALGNVIIVPTNSQTLHNPHYTGKGSPAHMIVIIGYDSSTQEFITNDPGTRYGEKYRYKESTINNSLRDYPTGPYQKISTIIHKDMIIVYPK